MSDPYKENGYRDRKHYLESLSEYHDMPINTVLTLACLLGADEDFDGLVVALEDAADGAFDD